MTDTFDLKRFVDAQAPVYPRVVEELRRGRKQSQWMWFVFPQLAGLGHSAMARRLAVSSSLEAIAYLEHQVLGSRLRNARRSLVRGRAGQSWTSWEVPTTSNSARR
jgi:uncharacterized protein (DUF1810 family)